MFEEWRNNPFSEQRFCDIKTKKLTWLLKIETTWPNINEKKKTKKNSNIVHLGKTVRDGIWSKQTIAMIRMGWVGGGYELSSREIPFPFFSPAQLFSPASSYLWALRLPWTSRIAFHGDLPKATYAPHALIDFFTHFCSSQKGPVPGKRWYRTSEVNNVGVGWDRRKAAESCWTDSGASPENKLQF